MHLKSTASALGLKKLEMSTLWKNHFYNMVIKIGLPVWKRSEKSFATFGHDGSLDEGAARPY